MQRDPGEDEFSGTELFPASEQFTYHGPLGDTAKPGREPPPSYDELKAAGDIAPDHDPDRYFLPPELRTAEWLRAHGVDVKSVRRRSGGRAKTPDAVMTGVPVTLEMKRANPRRGAISQRIRYGRRQSRRVVVDLRAAPDVDRAEVIAGIAQALRMYGADLDELLVIIDSARSVRWSRASR